MLDHEDDVGLNKCIRQSQAGSLKAFDHVVRRFELPIRAWAAAHCPPGIDADEVAQRTFIAAFKRLEEFKPGTKFSAWLFTIARYQLMGEVTRSQRIADCRTRYALNQLNMELGRRTQLSDDAIDRKLSKLTVCLEELAEKSRLLIEWRYRDEISLNEMAGRTGRSVAAIKKQLWLVRQKLRECVEAKLNAGGGDA
tara:strand:- start:6198 stop:6785 length:588 start_codon:yes stop_codon:yes gene_type:complete